MWTKPELTSCQDNAGTVQCPGPELFKGWIALKGRQVTCPLDKRQSTRQLSLLSYAMDGDLLNGQCCTPFEQPGPDE